MNININIAPSPEELGKRAAFKIASLLREAIKLKGWARIILSTGVSQFETLAELVKQDLDWSKVEMFHLDEYVGLPSSHQASFRKYLKDRFVSKLHLKAAYYVDGEGDVEKNILKLSELLEKLPIDVGVVGIGENGHIAFNDPPADFETRLSYKIVTLDQRCRRQQVSEGWFASLSEVPLKAVTMCPRRIMASAHIVSAVPHKSKAEVVRNTLIGEVSPEVPATLMKRHKDWNLFLDTESASLLFKA